MRQICCRIRHLFGEGIEHFPGAVDAGKIPEAKEPAGQCGIFPADRIEGVVVSEGAVDAEQKRQFRPPAGKLMLEFPAGLIEPGETPAETAERELYEETGYRGKVCSVSNPGYSSPGLTGEPITMVTMEIDGAAFRNREVVPHPEDSECIECFRVPRRELAAFIREQEAQNVGVDTKLYVYALALNFPLR